MLNTITPKDIVDDILTRTSEALLRGDFQRFMGDMALPQRFVTPDKDMNIDSFEDAEGVFRAVQTFLFTNNVAQIVRNCIAAEFRDENTISATHETRFINEDMLLVQAPYPTFSILRQIESRWMIVEMQSGMVETSELARALRR
jgi:hypothetical protein